MEEPRGYLLVAMDFIDDELPDKLVGTCLDDRKGFVDLVFPKYGFFVSAAVERHKFSELRVAFGGLRRDLHGRN